MHGDGDGDGDARPLGGVPATPMATSPVGASRPGSPGDAMELGSSGAAGSTLRSEAVLLEAADSLQAFLARLSPGLEAGVVRRVRRAIDTGVAPSQGTSEAIVVSTSTGSMLLSPSSGSRRRLAIQNGNEDEGTPSPLSPSKSPQKSSPLTRTRNSPPYQTQKTAQHGAGQGAGSPSASASASAASLLSGPASHPAYL